jgi:hypothetical protein
LFNSREALNRHVCYEWAKLNKKGIGSQTYMRLAEQPSSKKNIQTERSRPFVDVNGAADEKTLEAISRTRME